MDPLVEPTAADAVPNTAADDGSDSDSDGSSSGESHISQRLIAEHLGDAVGKGNGGGGGGVISSFLVGDKDRAYWALEMAKFKLSPKAQHKWRWFVTCMVHLRFADSAEQQIWPFHAKGVFPMATKLTLALDVVSAFNGGEGRRCVC